MVDHEQFVEDIPKDLPRLFPTTCRHGVQLSGSTSCSGLNFSGRTRYCLCRAKNCEDHSAPPQNLFPLRKLSVSHYSTTLNNPRDTLGLRTLAQQALFWRVSGCYIITIWLFDLGPASTHTKHTTSENKHITDGTTFHDDRSTWTRKHIKRTSPRLWFLVDNMPA